jgi:cytochrome b
MQTTGKVKVWDPLVRVFHWTLVIVFFTAYATGEEAPPIHEWMGYTILVLVTVRVVWGFIGFDHARFSDFVRGPGEVARNLRDILLLHPRRYIGHSPAGGTMVILLLVMLFATTLTGVIGDAQMEASVSASAANSDTDERKGEHGEHGEEGPIIELHEVLANVTLALVLLHIIGVILASFAHRENLIAAMITGRKRG